MPTESSQAGSDDLALLGLLQLVSPALPIGAFAWSQGLESAFDLGWVSDEVAMLGRCGMPKTNRSMLPMQLQPTQPP